MAKQNRYSSRRHRGPTHRGFKIKEAGMEGRIPVIVAVEQHEVVNQHGLVIIEHCRAFYCHPTKGWRSTGPEGRR